MQESSSSTKNDNDHENNEPPSKNAKAAEKKKLIEQIKELRFIIKQCKQDLQISCFKDVEKYVTKEHLQRLEISPRELPNVEYDLQTDLYRFAGFWCVKSQRHELIFNFTSSNKEQKDYTYAVQIFIENKKSTLGKWVMPMSINMDQLLSETPIKEPKDLISFVKNCKHHVACYTVRQEQFLSLQKHISQIKYCTLQTDIGFRLISLELFGTYDKENNKYMNLIIHLRYYSDKARPYAIEVDTRDKSKLSDETKQKLKSWLKKFRMYNLQTAFDKILKEDSIFIWTQTNDESLLELNV
ncbi:hypothetical protein PUN28_001209 [Cardiocondyla obscurior]|uniref:Uncharacterized protein n=1 Tax=Cardiocondyla obscurior TaxID=286306 RepID=A0AAW2H4B8_9HYME